MVKSMVCLVRCASQDKEYSICPFEDYGINFSKKYDLRLWKEHYVCLGV